MIDWLNRFVLNCVRPLGRKRNPIAFDAQFYLENYPDVAAAGVDPIAHFNSHGWRERRDPHPHFSTSFYLSQYPDVARAAINPLEHYINYGCHEGRRTTGDVVNQIINNGDTDTENTHVANAVVHAKHARLLRSNARIHREAAFTRATKNIERILQSSEFLKTVDELQTIEPGIGDLRSYKTSYIAPFHDSLADLHMELRGRLKSDSYDTIICVPWVRTGGADLVSSLVAQALLRIRPQERVLLLRTDQPNFEWPEIIPSEVECEDISDIVQYAGQDFAERLLFSMFRGLKPARVINVNSRLCWSAFKRFGRCLVNETHLYSYLFCWDRTLSGLRVGYPTEFFAETAGFLTATITDTHFLRDELIRMYNLPPALQERLLTMYSPPRIALRSPTAAQSGAQTLGQRTRPLILWAGRLDRQKRFDLVEEIARSMPDVDFHCWGKALLDAPPDLSKLPRNVRMMGSFKSYDELPLAFCDGWLYTSAWDGMPTILIELANQGMPIVASAVEGVCELIGPESGWPVSDWQNPLAYVAALREMITSPKERVTRAKRLQNMASESYSVGKYDSDLAAALSKEMHR
ncbi:MAG: glycosyltransferase family 4 protein [Methylovirgula sp.]